MIKITTGVDTWFMVDNKRETTNPRGDRLFVSLLGSAFIHLAWLGLVGSLLWIATIICVAYFVLVFKYV